MMEPTYRELLDALIELYNQTAETMDRIGEHNELLDQALNQTECLIDKLRDVGLIK